MIANLRRVAFALCLITSVTMAAGASETGFWQSSSGPLPDDNFGLTPAWERELGSGYSSISISDGKAITLFTSGEVDVVAAFDVATGGELWRYELGEKYAGHTGSTDGPLSTPAISGKTVYAVGPFGQVVALDLGDGRLKWRRDLGEEDSTEPVYGYTTSPLVIGDRVIVATGGDGHAVTAFDAASGEPQWTAGDDSVSYQTPTVLETGGRSLLIAPTDQLLQAFDLSTGEALWQLRHSEGAQNEPSAHVIPIDNDRVLFWHGNGSTLYRVSAGGAEELWTSNALGNSLAVPARVGDYLYGFTGNFLTCASLETGEIVWRSRPPGGLGLTVVDGVLAIVAQDGDLVLVDPSPEGYRELARLPIFDQGDYAVPSFSDGVFVTRNLERLAAVRVDPTATPQVAQIDPTERIKGSFGAWIESVEGLPEAARQPAVDSRLAAVEATPISEENGLVHFVWRGEAEDVGVTGDVAPPGGDLGLYKLAGTDLFFRSLELDPKAQYTYALTVDYEQPQTDPGNSISVDNGFQVVSELRMPEWPDAPFLEEPDESTPRGTLDSFPFKSEILDNSRELKVWRPAGYGSDPEARYPLLVVNHGDNLLRGGLMQNTLDNLVGKSVAPLIAVFVPRLAGPEYGGEQADDYTRFLVEELLPHLDRHYLTDGENRAIMGPGSAGVAAIYAAFKHPDVFQQSATQSYYPIVPAQDRIPEMIAETGDKPSTVYVVWSNHDYDLGQGRRAQDASQDLIERLRAAGVNTVEQVSDYSPGWGGWRGQDDEILAALFPLAESGE